MAELALLATIAGTIMQASGQMAAGKAAQKAADFEAAQLDIKAKEERAAAQRESEQYEHQTKLALSELQSKGAAGGFTATDPTALALADEITKYGTFQQQMVAYGGESRGQGLESQAAGRRYEGAAKAAAAKGGAAATLLSGFGGLAKGY